MNETFSVKVGEFEGPLDVLLSLIEERKMHISDVSLSEVTEDFIAYIQSKEYFPAEESSHFILTASLLLLIKSKSLLPAFTLTDDEEEEAKNLEDRLILYRMFREVGETLRSLSGRIYFGGSQKEHTPLFSPAPDITPESLSLAFMSALSEIPPPKEKIKEVKVKTVISIEDMMHRFVERIQKTLTGKFTDMVGAGADRYTAVVGFLALLELVKRGIVVANQNDALSEIFIEYSGNPHAPRYN